MRKVYICSPYRAKDGAELDRNIDYAQQLTRQALEAGLAPIARKMARQINKTLPTVAETLTAALNCWVQGIKPALATLCENVAAAFSNMAAGLREESEAVEND